MKWCVLAHNGRIIKENQRWKMKTISMGQAILSLLEITSTLTNLFQNKQRSVETNDKLNVIYSVFFQKVLIKMAKNLILISNFRVKTT